MSTTGLDNHFSLPLQRGLNISTFGSERADSEHSHLFTLLQHWQSVGIQSFRGWAKEAGHGKAEVSKFEGDQPGYFLRFQKKNWTKFKKIIINKHFQKCQAPQFSEGVIFVTEIFEGPTLGSSVKDIFVGFLNF